MTDSCSCRSLKSQTGGENQIRVTTLHMHHRVNQVVSTTISGEKWSICIFMHCSDVGSGIILVCFENIQSSVRGIPSLAGISLCNTVKDTIRRSFRLRIPNFGFSHLPSLSFRPALAPELLEKRPTKALKKWGLRKPVKRHVYSLFEYCHSGNVKYCWIPGVTIAVALFVGQCIGSHRPGI